MNTTFPLQVGTAICLNWGGSSTWELISAIKGDSVFLNTLLIGNVFTPPRAISIDLVEEIFVETRNGYRVLYNDPNWSGVKTYDMDKVEFTKPLR